MFKICLIGCGGMAYGGHAPGAKKYVSENEGTVLAGCCDTDIEKAERFCREFGFVNAYTDYRTMLDSEKPDVVMLTCPVALTAPIAMDVMNKGYHIIMEKPPGVSKEDTKAIHECAVKNNVHARVAFNRRYMPLINELKKEILSVGKPIHHIDCHFIRQNRVEPDFCTTAIHGIDTVKFLAGSDYKKIDFVYQDYTYNDNNICNYYLNAEFDNNVFANINFLRCSGCTVERIHVSCEEYTFFLETPVWGGADVPGKLECLNGGRVYKSITGKESEMFECSGFYDENASFFDIVRSGAEPSSDVETGIQSVDIADYMRKRLPSYSK